MARAVVMAAVVITSSVLSAQTPGRAVDGSSFAVASVKRATPPPTVGPIITRAGALEPGGKWLATNANLVMILRAAYPEYSLPGQIAGGPNWLAMERFDIVALAEGDPPRDRYPAMVRQLLADRFHLKTHIEVRLMDVYVLVLARSDGRLGPGLKTPVMDCAALSAARARGEAPPLPPLTPGERVPCIGSTGIGANRLMQVFMPSSAVGSMTTVIQGASGRPILDRTGLTDRYDIDLEFAIDPLRGAPNTAVAADAGPSIFTALQEQLGLKLEPKLHEIEVLVIDHVEMPTPD